MSNATEHAWTELDGVAHVVVGWCAACDYEFFPPQELGCERCGAAGDRLSHASVPAVGTVRTRVTVHIHPTLKTPFDVVEVILDGTDVAVQATASGDAGHGSSVIGRIVERDGPKTFEFIPAGVTS